MRSVRPVTIGASRGVPLNTNLAPWRGHVFISMHALQDADHVCYERRSVVTVLDDQPRRCLPDGVVV
jgi:hypothetical protein